MTQNNRICHKVLATYYWKGLIWCPWKRSGKAFPLNPLNDLNWAEFLSFHICEMWLKCGNRKHLMLSSANCCLCVCMYFSVLFVAFWFIIYWWGYPAPYSSHTHLHTLTHTLTFQCSFFLWPIFHLPFSSNFVLEKVSSWVEWVARRKHHPFAFDSRNISMSFGMSFWITANERTLYL